MTKEENKRQSSLINIPQLINAYRHNWKWVAVSVLAFLALGVLVYKKQDKTCEVSAQVLISDEGSKAMSSLGEMASMFSGGSFGSNRSVEDEMVIIKAHSLLKETVEKLDMNVSYTVRKNILKQNNAYYDQPVKLIYDKSIADTLNAPLTFRIKVNEDGNTDVTVKDIMKKTVTRSENATLPLTLNTPYGSFTLVKGNGFISEKELDETIVLTSYDQAALTLGNLITVSYSAKRTDIMSLYYITTDARFGKAVIDTLINNYNNITIEQKRDFNRKTLQFLEDRIAILSAEVDSTQALVEAFMGRRDLVNPQTQAGIYIQRTSTQEVELVKAEAEYELLTMAIEFLSNEANNTAMLPIMPSTASLTPLIEGYNQLILNRLTIESSAKGNNMALKAINAQIYAVRDNLLTALNKQAETANVEINEMRHQFAKTKKRLDTMPEIEREYVNLTRQQSLKEQLYVYLLRQREETEMAIAGAHPRGVIIDQAFITDSILGMSPKIILAIFIIMGLAFPAVIILAKWQLSKYISTTDQAHDLSGGKEIIANVSDNPNQDKDILASPQSDISQQVRLLRSNILSLDNLPSKTKIAIMGSLKDQDTSSLSLNLAISMALTGRKTAIIDANPFVDGLKDLVSPISNQSDRSCCNILTYGQMDLDKSTKLDIYSLKKDNKFGDDRLASISFASEINEIADNHEIVILTGPSIDNHYVSVETIYGLVDISLITLSVDKTLKRTFSKLSVLKNSNTFIINIKEHIN